MNRLSDKQIVDLYNKAIKLALNKEFIKLILEELKNRKIGRTLH